MPWQHAMEGRQLILKSSNTRPAFVLSSYLLLVLLLTGCGGGPKRVAARGSVEIDGQPLSQGVVIFAPTAGTQGPEVVADVVDGTFQLATGQGPVIGKHKVRIFATPAELDFALDDPREFSQHVPPRMPPNPIPPQFNQRTTLEVTTSAESENEFTFRVP